MGPSGAPAYVDVKAPSRLHFGLVNTSVVGERLDGGSGLMLERPCLQLRLAWGCEQRVPAPLDGDFRAACHAVGLPDDVPVGVTLLEALPSHQGLGSRTQTRLALATALASLSGRPLTPSGAARALGRGGTSSVGSWGFWHGGFIVDGGHRRSLKGEARSSSDASSVGLAPLVYAGPFPWWIVLAVRSGLKSVSGPVESRLFKELTPTSPADALQNYRLTYGELLPALLESDLDGFCLALDQMMKLGLKRKEIALHGRSAELAISDLRAAGLKGVGMSSWGSTFFGFAATHEECVQAAESLTSTSEFSTVLVTGAATEGATLAIAGGPRSAASRLFDRSGGA